ncbi:hypothetical protein CKAN_02292700 [Cinnamomum micranthum f. kanehirae]|uniref:Uncharacterized protein n=1 Tax=Cinnamomum micranthum f. kanehirae TaxID=337451 RepID=A0A443PSH0_9MAGN|nr:hypothetical protein CKAN_02292700 [Cinnamomum micranthum f. kanehirae]
MGTEILHPQDCLIQRLRAVPSISPRRKQHTNPRTCRKQAKRSPQPDLRKSYPEDCSPKPGKSLVPGQVMILKRGESLDSKKSEFKRSDLKKSVSLNEADLVVCGTERLGPDPDLVPKQIRMKESVPLRTDMYAGSAFSQSPSPRLLPLPNFSFKKGTAAAAAVVDDSATKDLRRLLRLD